VGYINFIKCDIVKLVLVAISLGALAIIDGAAGKIASKGIGLFKSRKS